MPSFSLHVACCMNLSFFSYFLFLFPFPHVSLRYTGYDERFDQPKGPNFAIKLIDWLTTCFY